jgi:hypothetical protein
MTDLVVLALMLFFVQLGIGGGLYETLVMYPRWKHDVTPASLLQKLDAAGQLRANRWFWPVVSMGAALLSIVNLIVAWRSTGDVRAPWLTAAAIIFLNRLVTFSYFAPTMMRKFEHPEKIDAAALRKSVAAWTMLSPLRTCAEIAAWCFGIWAIFSLR